VSVAVALDFFDESRELFVIRETALGHFPRASKLGSVNERRVVLGKLREAVARRVVEEAHVAAVGPAERVGLVGFVSKNRSSCAGVGAEEGWVGPHL